MIIACVADSHFDESSRFEECVRLHDWIATDLERRRPDLICHAGDVFEKKSTPAERLAVARWLRRCSDIAPVLVVRGNHDVLGDLPIFARLKGKHPVHVEEAASIHVINGVAVAAMAWPRKAEMLAWRCPNTEETAADALRGVLRGLGAGLAQHEGPRLLLAHAMVRASRTSTGQPLCGCDFELGLEDLALADADAYLLGHIHMGQDWTIGSAPCFYPGSPRRTAYGELEPKGYALVHCERAGSLTWERVETPATTMLQFEYDWTDGMFCREGVRLHEEERGDVWGAECRFRYRVASDQREAARAAAAEVKAEWIEAGALAVKVEEEVIAVSRARLPEVARLRSLREKLEALWRHRGAEPDAVRRARLLAKVESLGG